MPQRVVTVVDDSMEERLFTAAGVCLFLPYYEPFCIRYGGSGSPGRLNAAFLVERSVCGLNLIAGVRVLCVIQCAISFLFIFACLWLHSGRFFLLACLVALLYLHWAVCMVRQRCRWLRLTLFVYALPPVHCRVYGRGRLAGFYGTFTVSCTTLPRLHVGSCCLICICTLHVCVRFPTFLMFFFSHHWLRIFCLHDVSVATSSMLFDRRVAVWCFLPLWLLVAGCWFSGSTYLLPRRDGFGAFVSLCRTSCLLQCITFSANWRGLR